MFKLGGNVVIDCILAQNHVGQPRTFSTFSFSFKEYLLRRLLFLDRFSPTIKNVNSWHSYSYVEYYDE